MNGRQEKNGRRRDCLSPPLNRNTQRFVGSGDMGDNIEQRALAALRFRRGSEDDVDFVMLQSVPGICDKVKWSVGFVGGDCALIVGRKFTGQVF